MDIKGIKRLMKNRKKLLARRVLFSALGVLSTKTPCTNCTSDAGNFKVKIAKGSRCAACGFGSWP